MNDTVRHVRNFFVSLKLTVVLLVLGMVLIFWATVGQVDLGVWGVQKKFFHSLFVFEKFPGTEFAVPVFPGGYFLGTMLLINLISAHIYRFKFVWRKTGILMTHIGLILLLVGELLTGLWSEEYAMRINNGETKNYAESYSHNELVITDTTDAQTDEVVAIPEAIVARGDVVQHPKLPFRVVIKAFYPNSSLVQRGESSGTGSGSAIHATNGFGQRFDATPDPLTYKQDERNIPAAYVELIGAEGPVGTWLVTALPMVPPQHFEYGGRSWKITLRFARAYKPFSLTLLKFSHDVYAGTDIPKNFSSHVLLKTPDGSVNRDYLIYMNNPLRYAGLTFYQADYDHDKDQYTVLQVVRNPSWILPYIACSLLASGLVIQFGIHLLGFIGKRRLAQPIAA